jgi:5-methylcytosine-specific restriction protein A
LTTIEKILEAVSAIHVGASPQAIRKYIDVKWDDRNTGTIAGELQLLTVNHFSRVNYGVNKKSRLTNLGSKHDKLFMNDDGSYVLYDASIHGVWEIYRDGNEHKIRKIKQEKVKVTFAPADIVWFKNVTNRIEGEAYMNIKTETFVLHFPNIHAENGNIKLAKQNELIIISQVIEGVRCLTHLVTPIDDIVVHDNSRTDYKYGRNVRIITFAPFEFGIKVEESIWNDIKYPGITQGNVCNLNNISSIKSVPVIQLETWNLFIPFFNIAYKEDLKIVDGISDELEFESPELTGKEGKSMLISHMARERNLSLVRKKKKIAFENGVAFCSVCNFSFIAKYNAEFIECHHIVPISAGERLTSISELELVCSNCHRMLHKQFQGKFLSIAELINRIKELGS